MSTRAVYRPRKLYINSNQERKRKHFWSTQLCRPGRYLNREQQSKSISGAAVYHQRGIAVYQQQYIKKINESASGRHRRVDQGGISMARAVYQQQSKLKRKHFWSIQPCRPGRRINHNQQSEIIPGAAVYHQRGIAVYQ